MEHSSGNLGEKLYSQFRLADGAFVLQSSSPTTTLHVRVCPQKKMVIHFFSPQIYEFFTCEPTGCRKSSLDLPFVETSQSYPHLESQFLALR